MRPRLADPALTLELTWIWLGVLLAALLAYGLYRWWRSRHPRKPLPAPRSYSAELGRRMQKPKSGRAKRKRRGKVSRKTLPRQK
jgi:hypothetical protein